MPQPTAPTSSMMSTRALARGAASVVVESRTFEAVLTSEHPVRTWIPSPTGGDYIEVDEVLLTSGVDLSRARGMPLLDSHCAWGIDHHLGQVDAIRAEVVAGVGDCLVISARVKPSRAEIVTEMADGFHPNLSAGYVVHEYDLVQRMGDVPLARATRWTLLEASLVPIGADPNASVRSGGAAAHPLPTVRVRAADPATMQDSVTMDLETQLAAAEAAIAAADTAIAALPAETPAGTVEALSLRAAAIRKRAAATEKPKEESREGGDSGETDEEKAKREADAAAEKNAVEGVRSIAKTYGADVSKLVDDLAALGSPAAEIRSAVRSAVAARGAATPSTTVQPSTRSAAAQPRSALDIYARMNKPRS